MLNFKVTIIDDRKEWANKKRFPHVDGIMVGHQAKLLAQHPCDQSTYIMIATQEHKFDFDCLKACINSSAGYIAVIASRIKRAVFLDQLKKLKIPQRQRRKIKIPAGIDIGSQTPEEIAISVIAEIIKNYNKCYLNTPKFQVKK